MSRVRVHNFALSLDGFAAGPDQSVDAPLGVGGLQLHEWAFATRSFQQHLSVDYRAELGLGSGADGGLDDEIFARSLRGIGATIMGRNMFGPVRGPWGDSDWNGWWGDDPPFRHPVFILTHHERAAVTMTGGTTFHFVTDGIEAALHQAREAADGDDVRIGGGAATIRQYLAAGLIDELHLVVVPVLLGGGEPLFADGDDLTERYACVGYTPSEAVAHLQLERR